MEIPIFISMKHTRYIIPIVLGLILALLFCGTRMCHKPETVTVTDTITVSKTDTLFDTTQLIQFFPKPVFDTIIRWDTIRKDTPVPYVQKVYKDTLKEDDGSEVEYMASVSGYNPNLDTLRFRLKYPVITTEITNTVTNTEYITKKQSRLSIGPSVGFGYGFFNKNVDLYAGLSVTYRF